MHAQGGPSELALSELTQAELMQERMHAEPTQLELMQGERMQAELTHAELTQGGLALGFCGAEHHEEPTVAGAKHHSLDESHSEHLPECECAGQGTVAAALAASRAELNLTLTPAHAELLQSVGASLAAPVRMRSRRQLLP